MDPAHVSIADDEMLQAVQAAPATRPGRYTILSELDLSTAAVGELMDRAFGRTS
jgi:hypothetical protein